MTNAQTEWMHPPSPNEPEEGAVDMGRYVLKRVLATGGLGKVWLAHDRELRRDIALKEIQRNLVGRQGIEEQFQIEALVTGQLEHPGIVTVHDIGRFPDGRLYYCMKLVQGPTLRAGLRELRSLPSAAACHTRRREYLDAFLDVCQAIAYAHSRGVLHLDLKPENIILGAFGDTQVLDWGLAKLRDTSDAGRPLTGLVGTPRYMSPEQIRGIESELTPAADVYALGVILTEIFLASDKRSLPVPDLENLIDSPRRLLTTLSRLPAPVRSICQKAMALDPAERFPSPTELAQELQRYLNHERVLVHREGACVWLQRWIRKHPTTATLAAVVLVAAVAWQWRHTQHSRQTKLLVDSVLMQARLDWEQGRPELALERLQLAEAQLRKERRTPHDLESLHEPRSALEEWIAFDKALERARFLSVDDTRQAEMLAACREAQSFAGSELPPGFTASFVSESRGRSLEELELLARWGKRHEYVSEGATAPLDPYLEGRRYLLEQRFEAAADRFQSVLSTSPDHFWATYFLAYSRQRMGDPRAAILGYSACLARHPDIGFIAIQRAAAFESAGDSEAAAADYKRAAQSEPSDPYTQFGLVVAALTRGDKKQAAALLDRLLSEHPQFPRGILERARLRRQGDDADGARADCEWLLAHHTLEAEALIERALVALSLYDLPMARQDIEMAQTLQPTLALAAAAEGRLLEAEGAAKEAIAAMRRAHELAPDDPRYWNNWIAALIEHGDERLAEKEARRLIAERPHYWLAHGNLITAMIRRAAPLEELQIALREIPAASPNDREATLRQIRMFEAIARSPAPHLSVAQTQTLRTFCSARTASLASAADIPLSGPSSKRPTSGSHQSAHQHAAEIHLYPPDGSASSASSADSTGSTGEPTSPVQQAN